MVSLPLKEEDPLNEVAEFDGIGLGLPPEGVFVVEEDNFPDEEVDEILVGRPEQK